MKKQKRLRIIILISILILWLSKNSYFFLVKLGGFSLLIGSLFELAALLIIFIAFMILVIRFFKDPEWRSRKNYAATVFSVLALLLLNPLCPAQVTKNTLQSRVKMDYCYDGTVNSSRLFFRENGKFEDFNIGFFGYVHYLNGLWEQSGDTIKLNFKRGEHRILGDRVLMKNDYLYGIKGDSIYSTFYYRGKCTGKEMWEHDSYTP